MDRQPRLRGGLHDSDQWRICSVAESPLGTFCRAWADENGALEVHVNVDDPKYFRVRFIEIADFDISFSEMAVTHSKVWDGVTDSTINHLLADQISPRIIAHEGTLVLHAGAVCFPNGALIMVGPSGSGKSTLTASLHQAGYRMLGDDAIIISNANEAECEAVYPSLRLNPDSISSIFEDEPDHDPVAHYSDKRNVRLFTSEDPGSYATKIGAIILLGDEQNCLGTRRLGFAEACVKLIEHSFWLDPGDMQLTKQKIEEAGKLAARVPIFELGYPRDFGSLPAVHRALLELTKNESSGRYVRGDR